jgi:hypothetical protein
MIGKAEAMPLPLHCTSAAWWCVYCGSLICLMLADATAWDVLLRSLPHTSTRSGHSSTIMPAELALGLDIVAGPSEYLNPLCKRSWVQAWTIQHSF